MGAWYGLFFFRSTGHRQHTLHGAFLGLVGFYGHLHHGSFFITTTLHSLHHGLTRSLRQSGSLITSILNPPTWVTHSIFFASLSLFQTPFQTRFHLGHSFETHSIPRHAFKHSFGLFSVTLYPIIHHSFGCSFFARHSFTTSILVALSSHFHIHFWSTRFSIITSRWVRFFGGSRNLSWVTPFPGYHHSFMLPRPQTICHSLSIFQHNYPFNFPYMPIFLDILFFHVSHFHTHSLLLLADILFGPGRRSGVRS